MFSNDNPFQRLSRFTILSGIGWMIDVSLTLGLVSAGLAVVFANAIGATAAVTFVYITAQRHVFRLNPGRLSASERFGAYVLYQVVAITVASVLIGAVAWILAGVLAELSPTLIAAIAKIVITPLTLYSNFLFMGWLLEGRLAWR